MLDLVSDKGSGLSESLSLVYILSVLIQLSGKVSLPCLHDTEAVSEKMGFCAYMYKESVDGSNSKTLSFSVCFL